MDTVLILGIIAEITDLLVRLLDLAHTQGVGQDVSDEQLAQAKADTKAAMERLREAVAAKQAKALTGVPK